MSSGRVVKLSLDGSLPEHFHHIGRRRRKDRHFRLEAHTLSGHAWNTRDDHGV